MVLWFYLEQISKGIKIKCIDLSERGPVDIWKGRESRIDENFY